MAEEEKLVLVFTGSLLDAEFIKHILEENGIGALLKNKFNESLVAGWVSGGPKDAGRVFVAHKNLIRAKRIVQTYIESSETENTENEGN